MRKRVLASAILGLVAICLQPISEPAIAAPLTSMRMVDGQDAFKRVTKLTTEIPWYTSLDYAEKMAQKENKPIFWMHMLGPLNGKT